jgi:ATP adenylyltransferase
MARRGPPRALGAGAVSGLDHLWAGWRSAYIESVSSPAPASPAEPATPPAGTTPAVQPDTCVFDRILSSGASDLETHIPWRSPTGLVVALLNAYPYGTGHLMIMPVRHTGDLETLQPPEAAALWAGVTQAVQAIKAAYHPDGLNVGANLGRAAGAGVPGHLHIHVLPRWAGDTNFMTSIAETRVLPESLSVTAAKLRRAWPR